MSKTTFKRGYAGLVFFFTTLFCFAGGVQEGQLSEINVSYVKSPFNLSAIVMKERGMLEEAFAEQEIEVKYHEINSGAKQAQAMAGGSLDIGGVMNTTSVILTNSAGNDVRIVSAYSRPIHVFSIVSADDEIRTVEDLRGKKVAGPKGTVLHQLLAAALQSKGMSLEDVEFLQMDLPQAATAMSAGQIDAALLAGNLVINAQKTGAHIITTAEGLVTPTLVIAARGPFVDTHPQVVELYIDTNRAALAWIEENLNEALQMGAEEQGISLEDARTLYTWTQFADTLEARDLEAMEADIDFMLQNGMLTERISAESCVAEAALP